MEDHQSLLAWIQKAISDLFVLEWNPSKTTMAFLFCITLLGAVAPVPPCHANCDGISENFQMALKQEKIVTMAEYDVRVAENKLLDEMERTKLTILHHNFDNHIACEYWTDLRVKEAKLEAAMARHVRLQGQARRSAGIWSKYGFDECRSHFMKSIPEALLSGVEELYEDFQNMFEKENSLNHLHEHASKMPWSLAYGMCDLFLTAFYDFVLLLQMYDASIASIFVLGFVFLCSAISFSYLVTFTCYVVVLKVGECLSSPGKEILEEAKQESPTEDARATPSSQPPVEIMKGSPVVYALQSPQQQQAKKEGATQVA
eukprot:Rmarinus@m.10959